MKPTTSPARAVRSNPLSAPPVNPVISIAGADFTNGETDFAGTVFSHSSETGRRRGGALAPVLDVTVLPTSMSTSSVVASRSPLPWR